MHTGGVAPATAAPIPGPVYPAAPPAVFTPPIVYEGLSAAASGAIFAQISQSGMTDPHVQPYVAILGFITKGELTPSDITTLEKLLIDGHYHPLCQFVNGKRSMLLAKAISTPIWKILFGLISACGLIFGGVMAGGYFLLVAIPIAVGFLKNLASVCGKTLPILIIVCFAMFTILIDLFKTNLWSIIKTAWSWIGRTFFAPSAEKPNNVDAKPTECVVDCEVINEIASLFSHFGNVEVLKLALSMMLGGMIAMNSSMTMLDPVTNLSVPLFPALPSQLTQHIFTAGNMSNHTSFGRAKFDFGDLPETKFQRMIRERMEKEDARVEDAPRRHWIHAYAETFAISLSAIVALEGGKIAVAALYARRLAYLARLAAAELTMQAGIAAQAQALNAAVGVVGLAAARRAPAAPAN